MLTNTRKFWKNCTWKKYAFYHEIGIQEGINEVILGHHLNDYLENIIMQIKQNKTKRISWYTRSFLCTGNDDITSFIKSQKGRTLSLLSRKSSWISWRLYQLWYKLSAKLYSPYCLKNYDEKELLAYAKKHNESYLKKQEYLKQMMEVYKQQHFLNLNKSNKIL